MTKTSILFVIPLFVGGLSIGCEATDDGGDGGATGDGSRDVTTTDARDGGAGDGAAAGDAAPTSYTAIMIVDKGTDNTKCAMETSGPGADIDAVELRSSAGTILGVGKMGSVSYTHEMATPCATCGSAAMMMCTYSQDAFKARVTGVKDGEVKAVGEDIGYFSLNNGRAVVEIGDATGSAGGAVMSFQKGAQIKVWEVDKSYITAMKAPATCNCNPDRYEVYALVTRTSNVGAVKLTATTFETENTAACATMGMQVGGGEGCGSTLFTVP